MTNIPINAGLDVGYSSIKLVFDGPGGTRKECIWPSFTAPKASLGRAIAGRGREDGYKTVIVDGAEWVCGLRPTQGGTVAYGNDYHRSPGYKASCIAALATIAETHGVRSASATSPFVIREICTGLPVTLSKIDEEADYLIDLIEGTHEVAPGLHVRVEAASVVPQPIGGYANLRQNHVALEIPEEVVTQGVLVVDPGHYTFDWALIADDHIVPHADGANNRAMMDIYRTIANRIYVETKGASNPGYDKLHERIAIDGKDTIFFSGGRKISIAPYIEETVGETAAVAAQAMINSFRGMEIDIGETLVYVVGGGAHLYAPIIERALRGKIGMLKVSPTPVLANALGYHALAYV